MAPRAKGKATYAKGYADGWNHRALGERRLRKNARILSDNATYAVGYRHGWHDGEGRGVSLKEFQAAAPGTYGPKPKSWEQYEKEMP
jgi:hypothetical protein